MPSAGNHFERREWRRPPARCSRSPAVGWLRPGRGPARCHSTAAMVRALIETIADLGPYATAAIERSCVASGPPPRVAPRHQVQPSVSCLCADPLLREALPKRLRPMPGSAYAPCASFSWRRPLPPSPGPAPHGSSCRESPPRGLQSPTGFSFASEALPAVACRSRSRHRPGTPSAQLHASARPARPHPMPEPRTIPGACSSALPCWSAACLPAPPLAGYLQSPPRHRAQASLSTQLWETAEALRHAARQSHGQEPHAWSGRYVQA